MNYMLLVYAPDRTEERKDDCLDTCLGMSGRLMAEGKLLDGAVLHGTDCATSIRVRDGVRTVTDGPFAETREQLAGYMILDVENLDEAIVIAAKHPVAEFGTVEIRPFFLEPLILKGLHAETLSRKGLEGDNQR